MSSLDFQISSMDYYKENEYRLFGDCKKFEKILKTGQVIGKGSYGKVIKFCADSERNIGYAIKQLNYLSNQENDPDSPFYASLRIGYMLNLFVTSKMTPHIILTFGDFKYKIQDKNTHIIVSSLADGDLNQLVYNLSLENGRNILFQVIFTLATIQSKFPEFKHNDLSTKNIFYKRSGSATGFYVYKIGEKVFKVPNTGLRIFIADFDLSIIPSIINNRQVPIFDNEYNVTDAYNPYYDLSFLLYEIFNYTDIMNDIIKPILKGPDKGWNNNNFRPITNASWKTPLEILDMDIFSIYRTTDLSGDVIDTYDANQVLPKLDTSNLITRFHKSPTTSYVLFSEPGNMMEEILLKYCKLEKTEISSDTEYIKNAVKTRFKLVTSYANNYMPSVNIGLEDIVKLAEYTWIYMVKNCSFYNVDKIKLAELMLAKLLVYFTLRPNLEAGDLINVPHQVYFQIPMSVDFITKFFLSMSSSSSSSSSVSSSSSSSSSL